MSKKKNVKTEKTKAEQTRTPSRMSRLIESLAGHRRSDGKRRPIWSHIAEAALTVGAIVGVYALAIYAATIITPNITVLVAQMNSVDVTTASAQGLIAYWLAPSAVLLALLVVLVVAIAKMIWRLRGKTVRRLRQPWTQDGSKSS